MIKLFYFAASLLFLFCFITTNVRAQENASDGTRLLRFPTVSDNSVVFTYATDLWLVSRNGGKAKQLTSHAGNEFFARLSPDGKWVAFTGQYESGDYDVYVMPATGGEPKRLTYYPGYDQVLGWTPDSKRILFFSRRQSIINPVNKLFTVETEGGFPESLPLPDTGFASFSPDATKIAYNRVATEYRSWKRYRGGRQSYVSLYDLKSNKYDEIPHTDAADLAPMWFQNAVYFASDRVGGVMNLYRYDLRTKQLKKLTNYREFDVKYPSLGGTQNPAIVYENGGWLNTFDLKTEKISKVQITVESDLPQTKTRTIDAANYIYSFGISPDGTRAVFGARGEIFIVSAQNKEAHNLSQTSGANELQPVFSPDGRWSAYFSDKNGEYQIYLRAADGSGAEKAITARTSGYLFNPVWSPDSSRILFTDSSQKFFYVDINGGNPVLIAQSENSEIYNYSWSPDSRFVAYAKANDNLFRQIFIYSVEEKKSYPVTDGRFDDRNPVFDSSGKYLYFFSSRNYRPAFYFPGRSDTDWGIGYSDTTGIYAAVLTTDAKSPFAPIAEREDAAKNVQIDFQNINRRIVAAPIPVGNYANLRAGKNRLFYISRPPDGIDAANVLPPAIRSYNFENQTTETILTGGVSNFQLSANGEKIIYSGNGYGIVDTKPNQKSGNGGLDLSAMKMNLDPRAEWKQIFDEAWRIERDFYYDANLRGIDWAAIKKRYESLLPSVAHRDDLNYLIGEMVGELGTGHLYVYGGDMPNIPRKNIGLLGAEFEISDGFYRFKKIYRGDNSSNSIRAPLAEPGIAIKEGEYLLAVGGKPLLAADEIYSLFENTAGENVVLTVNNKPTTDGARKINVRPTEDEMPLRYFDWVEENRRKVSKATGGRCGYIHVPDTGGRGINEFSKAFYAQTDKEALIVDSRWNAGGYFPSFFIELLQRRTIADYAPRDGNSLKVPGAAITGAKVLITNEYNISGGDAFPYFFQKAKIGEIVGMRTAGATIGNTGTPSTIDDGTVETSALALWETFGGQGRLTVENRGVIPDVQIDNRPDSVVSGRDPQLEKAIEIIKLKLAATKPIPKRPNYK
jgi:tricorn protease